MLLLLALQAATPAPAPERFSILLPTPTATCRTRTPANDPAGDIVVCATTEASQALPLPDERGPPNRPMASNPNMTGVGALNAQASPCATLQSGCQVGVDVFGAGTAAIRLIQKLVAPNSCCEAPGEATDPFALAGDAIGGVRRMFRGKPDRTNRTAIDLSDPAPPPHATP